MRSLRTVTKSNLLPITSDNKIFPLMEFMAKVSITLILLKTLTSRARNRIGKVKSGKTTNKFTLILGLNQKSKFAIGSFL